jgi:hypothetical protein
MPALQRTPNHEVDVGSQGADTIKLTFIKRSGTLDRVAIQRPATLECSSPLSFIGGAFATGDGESQDQNPALFTRQSVGRDDGGGTSEPASGRPRQTERDDSVSARAPSDLR